MTAPYGGPPRRVPPTVNGAPPPPLQSPPRRPAAPQGHHFSGQPPRRPAPRRPAPRPQHVRPVAPSAAQQHIDRIAQERGGLYAADGQLRKPRTWHIAGAVTVALFLVAGITNSALLGFAGILAGIASGVLAYRRSKEAARHMANVRTVEHFARAVPRGNEDFADARDLRTVVQAGFAASNYLVRERIYLGAPDGQPVMNRAMAYRDAAERARAELDRRYPTPQAVMQQQMADTEDDVAAPVVYKPESDEDEDAPDDWRDALAADETEDWT